MTADMRLVPFRIGDRVTYRMTLSSQKDSMPDGTVVDFVDVGSDSPYVRVYWRQLSRLVNHYTNGLRRVV